MKKTILSAALLLCAALQFSCEHYEGENGAAYSKYMINCYIECENFSLKSLDQTLKLRFEGKAINPGNFDEFYPIARANNDTTYNRELVNLRYVSINDSLSHISIVCDKDINPNHPAGTELNDIFTFKAKTVYNIIQQNYNSYEAEKIEIPAKEVNFAKTRIIHPECELVLNQLPEKSGTYTFEVTIKLSEKTLKNTVTMEF